MYKYVYKVIIFMHSTYRVIEHFISEPGHLVSREHKGLLVQPEPDASNKQCPCHQKNRAPSDKPLTATAPHSQLDGGLAS